MSLSVLTTAACYRGENICNTATTWYSWKRHGRLAESATRLEHVISLDIANQMSIEVNDIILRIKHIIAAVEGETALGRCDRVEREMLDYLLDRQISGNAALVTELIAESKIASPASLHRRIAHLIDLELVAIERDPVDHRRKRLVLTKAAIKAYNKMSDQVNQTVLVPDC